MCQFLSGWISIDGRTIYPGDLVHHERGADLHGISETVACPWEWTADSLTVRVSPSADATGATAAWYCHLLRDKFGSRDQAIEWCLANLLPSVKYLGLRGTEVKVLPELPRVLSLDLRGCDPKLIATARQVFGARVCA